MEKKITKSDIEIARRMLHRHQDFSEYRRPPLPPFFGGVEASKQLPAIVVVDYSYSKDQEPVILLYYNGVVKEHNPHASWNWTTTEVVSDDRPHARFVRWLGDKTGIHAMLTFGLDGVVVQKTLGWDFTSLNPNKNLEYLTMLTSAVGITRLGVVIDPVVDMGPMPAMLPNGAKLYGIFPFYDKFQREEGFNKLAGYLFRRQIGLLEETELLKHVQAVPSLKVEGSSAPIAGKAHPVVETLAIFANNLKENEFGQLSLGND